MKIPEKMSVTKFFIIIIFMLSSFLLFSQEKKDVYFILDTKSKEYIISYGSNEIERGSIIYLSNRKQYLNYQKKKKKMIKEGSYEMLAGESNVNIDVSSRAFEIDRIKKVILTDWDTYELNRVDYKWLIENAWKPLCNTCSYNFKNIYFLYPIGKDTYMSYGVGLTVLSH